MVRSAGKAVCLEGFGKSNMQNFVKKVSAHLLVETTSDSNFFLIKTFIADLFIYNISILGRIAYLLDKYRSSVQLLS